MQKCVCSSLLMQIVLQDVEQVRYVLFFVGCLI